MNLTFLLAGLILLIFGGDLLLKSAVGFSLKLKIPKMIIGMTIVSFVTSAPELIVCIKSAFENHADLAFGNAVGSNIANFGLVLGITISLSTINTHKKKYETDWIIMIFSSVLLYLFVVFDKVLNSYEGAILFLLLIVFLVYLLKYQKKTVFDEINKENKELSLHKGFLFLIIGGIALWIGSEILIDGAVGLTKKLGVSERIIGITVVSVGTSIPELSASIIAVLKKEKSISLGNIIGSNIFNILAVLGITSIIKPITIKDMRLIESDIYWMLIFAFILMPLNLLFSKNKFGIKEGIILLTLYLIFIYKTIL